LFPALRLNPRAEAGVRSGYDVKSLTGSVMMTDIEKPAAALYSILRFRPEKRFIPIKSAPHQQELSFAPIQNHQQVIAGLQRVCHNNEGWQRLIAQK
jgi:hypothetical protein